MNTMFLGNYEHNVPWEIMNIMFRMEGNYEHYLPIQREIRKNIGKSEVSYLCKNGMYIKPESDDTTE